MGKQERNRHSVAATTEGVQRVKIGMAQRGWTREMLVDQAGLSKATVDRFFTRTNVDLSTVQAIADTLQLLLEDIIGYTLISSLGNEFYIYRLEEEKCYQALQKPGALVRVKAPQLMGKTWFLNQVLMKLSQRVRYRRVELEINRQSLNDIDNFFKWFCASVSLELNLPIKVDAYWHNHLTPSQRITNYFQKYLLPEFFSTQDSLLLVLDQFNHVFEVPAIVDELRALLRSWCDKPIKGNLESQEIWRHFRLVIVYATDIYGLSDDINYSPLTSVGEDVELQEFDQSQIEELAKRYRLSWNQTHTNELMRLVGGHPYLVDLACSYIKHQRRDTDKVLKRIIETACTQIGIYANHLLQLSTYLEQSPELKQKFKEIINVNEPIPIEATQAFKLYSMGLIKLRDASENLAEPRCRLYQKYFSNYFKR